jgi:hypothetical protein
MNILRVCVNSKYQLVLPVNDLVTMAIFHCTNDLLKESTSIVFRHLCCVLVDKCVLLCKQLTLPFSTI